MTGYIGARCPVCNKKFVTGDDIVVCPVCGAPHHRACYALQNQCAFEAEHIAGKPWKPEAAESAEGDFCINPQDGQKWDEQGVEAVTCAFCGSRNPKDNIFCCSCGNRLRPANPNGNDSAGRAGFGGFFNMDPTSAIYGGVLPTDTIGDHGAKEVATFVGRSSSYYLPRFQRIDSSEGKYQIDFNFSAFLFGFVYFFYRKMYKLGILFLALTLLLTAPSLLYQIETFPATYVEYYGAQLEQQEIDTVLILDLVDQQKVNKYEQWSSYARIATTFLRMMMGLFANYLYYKHTLSKMEKVRKSHIERSNETTSALEYETTLYRAGNVGMLGVTLSLLVWFCVFTLAGLWIIYVAYPTLFLGLYPL